jgi:arsenite-transporting ATPase
MAEVKRLFYLGKGGVGKSTISLLSGLYLSRWGPTLVLSLDPAHNLGDILKHKIGRKGKRVRDNLSVIEIDEQGESRRYLKGVEGHLRRVYSYQTAFAMENHFSLLRQAPAVAEFVLHKAFLRILNDYRGYHLVFDMPPTGLSLRFFSLPSINELWLDKLAELRRQILDKKGLIYKIHGDKSHSREKTHDKVLPQIKRLKEEAEKSRLAFAASTSRFHAVLQDNSLAHAEAGYIQETLSSLGIDLGYRIVNRSSSRHSAKKEVHLPEAEKELIGIEALQDYLKQNEALLERLVFV